MPSAEIINRASIYFDANDPILTNEVIRRIQIPTYATSQHLQLCEGEEFLSQIISSDTMMIDTTSNTPLGLYLDFYHLDITPAEISVDTIVQLGDTYNGVVITQDTVIEDSYVDDNGCEISVLIHVLLPVDIFDLELRNEIHIYPNPTSNQIFIEREDARIKLNQISIRNASGIKVKEIQTHDLAEKKIRVDVSGLLSGVYVIEINTELGIIFMKMIVVK